jgi:hypothetical protein
MFSSPQFPKRTKQEAPLFQSGQAMQSEAAGFASGMRARLADIANTTDERQRAARITSGDVWQADAATNQYDAARPGANLMERMLGRGKALTRMAAAGDQAVEGQALRERMSMAKFGQGVRTGNVRDLFQLSRGNDEFNAAKMRADQMTSGAQANLVGTLAGVGIGYGVGKFQDWKAGQDQFRTQMAKHGAEKI